MLLLKAFQFYNIGQQFCNTGQQSAHAMLLLIDPLIALYPHAQCVHSVASEEQSKYLVPEHRLKTPNGFCDNAYTREGHVSQVKGCIHLRAWHRVRLYLEAMCLLGLNANYS